MKVDDNKQAKCPSCGTSLKFGELLCQACGFNLQTGQRSIGHDGTIVHDKGHHQLEEEISWLDRHLRDIPNILLLAFAVVFNVFALILGLLTWILCDDEDARGQARVLTISGAMITVITAGLLGMLYWSVERGLDKVEEYPSIQYHARERGLELYVRVGTNLFTADQARPEQVFLEMLDNPHPPCRTFGAWAVGEVGNPASAPSLVAALNHDDPEVVDALVGSLEQLGQAGIEALIDNGLRHDDELIQKRSLRALQQITDKSYDRPRDWKRWLLRQGRPPR